jgi:hypothetical protein
MEQVLEYLSGEGADRINVYPKVSSVNAGFGRIILNWSCLLDIAVR